MRTPSRWKKAIPIGCPIALWTLTPACSFCPRRLARMAPRRKRPAMPSTASATPLPQKGKLHDAHGTAMALAALESVPARVLVLHVLLEEIRVMFGFFTELFSFLKFCMLGGFVLTGLFILL